jgi:hypothetical protein
MTDRTICLLLLVLILIIGMVTALQQKTIMHIYNRTCHSFHSNLEPAGANHMTIDQKAIIKQLKNAT